MELIKKWSLPIRTVSEANSTEHWRKKNNRHKAQKLWIKTYFQNEPLDVDLPIHVKLTRCAPYMLDKHDNLPMSFKWIFDEICSKLIPGKAPGRADDSDLITVEYDQVKSSGHSIRIEFFHPCKDDVQLQPS